MFNSTGKARKELIDAWVKKNKPKRYKHGERPNGEVPCEISYFGKRKSKNKAEEQAVLDAKGE